MNSLIFFIVCLIFKFLVEDYNKPVVSEMDQIINAITEKKPVKYISNGTILDTNFKSHYFKILDLENSKVYYEEMITEQAIKQKLFHDEDVKIGFKTRCNTNDIELAEGYILDYYNYVVHLN